MSTAAQIIANTANAQSSTGARTPEGKATSSKNAITYGLFATHDFIRPGEEALYAELAESLRAHLVPSGPLEHNLVDEIRRAMWRLRRCGQIEEGFATPEATRDIPDPMQNDSTAKLQISVDRARSLSHRLLHKCTAELGKLQTERQFRHEFFDTGTDIAYLGICDVRSIRKGLDQQVAAQYRRQKLIETTELSALLNAPIPQPAAPAIPNSGSFCKNDSAPSQTSRNGQCPCGSGLKHKRCCGRQSPAMLHAV